MKKVFFLLVCVVLQQMLQTVVYGQSYRGGFADGFSSALQRYSALNYTGGIADGFSASSQPFRVIINKPDAVCEEAAVVFKAMVSGSGGCRYEWQKVGGEALNATGAEYPIEKVTLADAGDYFCKVTDEGGVCLHSDTATLVVNKQPKINIPGMLLIPDGAPVTITALNDKKETLSPATGLSWSTVPSTTVVAGVNPFTISSPAGLESVHLTYKLAGCEVKATTLITPNGRLPIRGGTGDGFGRGVVNFGVALTVPQEACEKEDTVFKAMVVCIDDPLAYQIRWFKIGAPEVLSSSALFSFHKMALSAAGEYFCTVTSRSGVTIHSDTLALRVHAMPEVNIRQPFSRDTLMCYGDTLELFGSHTVDTAVVSWRGNGFPEVKNKVLVKVSPETETNYFLKADNHGCFRQDTVTVKINRPFVDIPLVVNLPEGNPLVVTAVDEEKVPLSKDGLKWYMKPSTLLESGVNPLMLPSVRKEMVIEVKLQNGKCTACDSLRINIKSGSSFRGGRNDGFSRTCLPPVILVQPTAGERQCVSVSQSLDLNVVAEGSSIAYSWEKFNSNSYEFEALVPAAHPGITGAHTPTLSFKNITDSDNGSYRCVLSNACSGDGVITDTCYVSVKGEPIIESGINVERDQCAGSGEFTFNVIARNSAGKGLLKYRWFKNGRQISEEVDTLKEYYKLFIGPTAEAEGTYVVEVSNSCGAVYDTAFLPVVLPPVVEELSKDVYSCSGGVAEFWVKTNRNEKYSYALYSLSAYSELAPKTLVGTSLTNKITLQGVVKEGYYMMRVYHPHCGETFSGIMTLHLEYPISIVQQPRDTLICAGGTVTLNVKATTAGEPRLKYQWYKDGVAFGAASDVSLLTIPNVAYERDTVRYECVVSNSCGYARSAAAKVVVKRAPVIGHGPEVLPEYCEGDTLRLEVILTTPLSEIDSVRWYYKGSRLFDIPGRISGATTTRLEIDSLTAAYGGSNYFLEAYNGCKSGVSRQVRFQLLEPARFVRGLTGVKLTMCDGEEQQLTVDATGSPSIRYIWTQNDVVVADGFSNRLTVSGIQLDEKDKFTCHVQNTCGDELTTTFITVDRLKTFALEGGGRFCERDPQGMSLFLRGSDTAALYRLYREPNIQVQEVDGRSVVPLFGGISFTGVTVPGRYYVKGINRSQCELRMPGTAEIKEDPLPADYLFSITRHLCENTSDADAELENSDPGVDYYLCKLNPLGRWDTVPTPWAGTGKPIRFVLEEGSYKIVAKNTATACTRDLTATVKVIRRPVPPLGVLSFVSHDSIYCAGSPSAVKLNYESFESGSSYQLKKGGIAFQPAKVAQPLLWDGLEQGLYSLQVTNTWGCRMEMGRKEVKPQAAPKRYSLVGRHYYCKEETGDSWIELVASEAGVRYSFRYLPGTEIKEIVSDGSPILLTIPLADRDYYVVATDTTPRHCSVAMYDTLKLRRSTLTVTPTSPVTANYLDQKTLQVSVSGEAGKPVYRWTPVARLDVGQEMLAAPKTKELKESAIFHVVVQDNSGCQVAGDVVVTVLGGDLKGGIRTIESVELDTLRLCRGDNVALNAVISGGACEGIYTYRWRDEKGSLAGGALLTPYVKTEDGRITLEVDCGKERVRDTVVILVNDASPVDTIVEPGLRCLAPGFPLTVRLKSSNAGSSYFLEYSADKEEWKDVTFQNGTGSALSFAVPADSKNPGYYRVRGEVLHKDGKGGVCKRFMAGEVEVREGAPAFSVTGGKEFCADVDSVKVELKLTGGVDKVTYKLWRLTPVTQAIDTFMGPDIDGFFHYREKLTEGEYLVKGKLGSCEQISKDTVKIHKNQLPDSEILDGAGEYCSSECPITLSIDHGKIGITYTLTYRSPAGTVSSTDYHGVGLLTFGTDYKNLGSYTLIATNDLTGCRTMAKDSVVIAAAPTPFRVEGSTTFCPDVTSVIPDLRLTGHVANVTYSLYKLPEMSVPVGTFTGPEKDGLLHYRKALGEGRYVVEGKIGECKQGTIDTIGIGKYAIPDTLQLAQTKPYDGCESDGLEIGFVSRKETKYFLYKDEVKKSELSGTGNAISFGLQMDPGTYYVMAEPAVGCKYKLFYTYLVEKKPVGFDLTGDIVYCENTEGVTIGLSGSENKTRYHLQRYNTGTLAYEEVFETPLTGTGRPIFFTGLQKEGLYRVVAGTFCQEVMDVPRTIQRVKFPDLALKLQNTGEACVDSVLTLYLASAPAPYEFQLYCDGTASGAAIAGAGGLIEWPMTPAKEGLYAVKTTVGGCTVTLPDSVEVRPVPLLDKLRGDTIHCAGSTATVYIAPYTSSAVYRLYILPVDTLFSKGVVSNARMTFDKLKKGTYYVTARNGDCRVRSKSLAVDSLLPLPLPGKRVADCVDQDSGWVTLTGLTPAYRYNYGGRLVQRYSGDTTFRKLQTGIYGLQVEDTLYGCKTAILLDTIREGVYNDSLKLPTAYCEGQTGATLSLSGVRLGMTYSILTTKGAVLESITRPTGTFTRSYVEGRYILRRERTAFPAGCKIEEEFDVKKRMLPFKGLVVNKIGKLPLCFGNEYEVELEATEMDIRYILQRVASPIVHLDTLFGDGSTQRFVHKISQTGEYRIVATDTLLGCPVTLDSVLTISPLPKATVKDCEYCYTPGSPAEGCGVELSAMENNVLYRMETLDTLIGPGSGVFKKQLKGVYHIIAVDTLTGCRDTFMTEIKTIPEPERFALTPTGCYPAKDVINIQTAGSAPDVTYTLYMDSLRYLPEVKLAGTGNPLSFGDRNEPGIYRVWAEGKNGCGVFTTDRVVVHGDLRFCDLDTVGSYLPGDTTTVVELRTKCSVKGWDYYVSDGYHFSDTLAGTGGTLAWDSLYPGKKIIRDGVYTLYAFNVCGTEETVGIGKVAPLPAPKVFPLVDRPSFCCAPDTFALVLSGSERGVKYIVKRYSTTGILLHTYPPVLGTGVRLVLGEAYDSPGFYEVLAENKYLIRMDFWEIKDGSQPKLYDVLGDDVCKKKPEDFIAVSLSGREPKVSYYLYRRHTEDWVDRLTPDYRPAPELQFDTRSDLGCYYVMAENGGGACRREMNGEVCLNEQPRLFRVEPIQVPGDTLRVCRGDKDSIYLSGSDLNMGYELLLDGMRVHTVVGTGLHLNAGAISESGVYRVRAYVCGVMMEDSVIVKVNELPSLSIDTAFRYCQGTDGLVRVLAPTSDQEDYSLYKPNPDKPGYIPMETRPGNADYSEFEFSAPVDAGYYYVEAKTRATGCVRLDSTRAVKELQPAAYELTSTSGNYICRGSSAKLGLAGSETEVRYELYRTSPTEKITDEYGTGKAFQFGSSIKTPGIYYVVATKLAGLGCSVKFGSHRLDVADTLLPFQVESVKKSYCITAATPQGSIRLNGSQAGKEYQLLKDNVPLTGSVKTGTGGILTWSGLEGKPCDDVAEVDGYVYRVVVRDPVSGCTRNMYGSDTIAAVSPLRILAREPSHPDFEKCAGSKVYFSVTVSGCRATYNWRKFSMSLKNGKDPFYNIEAVKPIDYGTYECVITNACGSITTPPVNLSVRELVTLETRMPDERVCDGQSRDVMFSSGFKNAETYAWYKLPDDTTVMATRDFHEISKVQIADSGTYVCVANNRCGVEARDTVRLFVDQLMDIVPFPVRSDTLCDGSSFTTQPIVSEVPFGWYLDGKPLSFTGSRYHKDPITQEDEGNYSVRFTNACGVQTLQVAKLYVDQKVSVESYTDGSLLRCAGETEQLYIKVTPDTRVEYSWVDTRQNVLGTGPTLQVGPFQRNSVETYRVWFLNKCSSGSNNFRDIVISTPDTIHFTDPLRDLVVCADCATDTVLRLGTSDAVMAEYEWYYRKKENDVQREIISRGDTIAIRKCTSNTGYYYCRVFNRCETKTTETSWVRVDSVPVVQSTLSTDTVCEGGWIGIKLMASGGGLTYRWNVLKKDGKLEQWDHPRADFVVTDELILSNVGIAYDSCLIWSEVFNGCGTAQSDTMVLRVSYRRELSLSPDKMTLCAGSIGKIKVTLEKGDVPWSFHYRTPGDKLIEINRITRRDSVIDVRENGTYRIVYLQDTSGCERTGELPSAEVKISEPFTGVLSGGGRRCAGDTISLRLQITGGSGPWNIWLSDEKGSEGNEMGPFRVNSRDTAFILTVMDNARYYIAKIGEVKADEFGNICSGSAKGVVEVTADIPDIIDFALSGDGHVGQCRELNLCTTLNPSLRSDGTKVSRDGIYYLNGAKDPLPGCMVSAVNILAMKGEQKVICKYTDAAGCLVTSGEEALYVDTLPSALLDAGNGHACGNVETEYTVALSGAPKFTLELEQRVLSYSRFHKDEKFRSWTPDLKAKDMVYKGTYPWRDEDSCMILRVVAITDRHACRITDGMPSDTIYHHLYPDLEMWTRYPDKTANGWNKGMSPVYISRGDSVGVKAVLTQGDRPWNLVCSPRGSISGIRGVDTVFALDTGRYRLTAVHAHCGVSADFGEELVIQYLDTGYLKLKVWLDGPLDLTTSRMVSSIEGHLPLYGLKALPAHGADRQIIDWIEVELRTGNDIDSIAVMGQGALRITRDSCLLWSDGTVTDRWGDTTVLLPQACAGSFNNYYVVLRHRNHLAVMSAGRYKISRTRKDAVKADFTKPENIYCSRRYPALKDHMSYLEYGGIKYWTLSAGDMNENRLVSVFDPNRVNLDELQGKPVVPAPGGYHLFDVNFDGVIGWPGWNGKGTGANTLDWDKVRANRYKHSEVKWKKQVIPK